MPTAGKFTAMWSADLHLEAGADGNGFHSWADLRARWSRHRGAGRIRRQARVGAEGPHSCRRVSSRAHRRHDRAPALSRTRGSEFPSLLAAAGATRRALIISALL